MSRKDDFNKLIDDIIVGAKNITDNLVEKSGEFVKDSGIKDFKDYYSFYSWPPLNLYFTGNKCITFEFGLPGFIKDDVSITFDGEYMLLSATLSNRYSADEVTKSIKSKLQLRDIEKQKYYLPIEKFSRKDFSMHMKNGLLRLVFSFSEEVQ